ncbi:MAG: T9SS type A sorting domain-containing protein [Bacteroidota bacterium]
MSTENSNKSRKHFLRNVGLATLSAGLLPLAGKSNSVQQNESTAACDKTTLDYYGQGPFYTPNAPTITGNQLALQNETGTRLILTGIVRSLDCSMIIPDTLIDVWHANDAGAYDSSGYNLRGVTYSNAQGFYVFETILPGKYLNGPAYRPRHIHFKITPPGFPALITQLYFEGDTSIPGDAAASITSGTYNATARIIPIALNGVGKYEGTWDIIISGAGVTGTRDMHLDKGIIYSASPNPFTDELEINYGVYQPAKVTLQVFDINGSMVASLDEKYLQPQKYKAVWKAGTNLAAGIYFAALKINDLQVHYLKVMKS